MEPSIESGTKKTIQFTITKPNTDKLKAWASALPEKPRKDFKNSYGNLLDLLLVDVQIEAISALAQYYDPALRCFTFTNFQLAPTLEEFASIIGQPLNEERPYNFKGSYPRPGTVAKALKVHPNKLIHKRPKKGGEGKQEGVSRASMEKLMDELVEQKNWGILVDVLALAIYDWVLFPTHGESIGPGATDVFLARKCRGESSIFPMLADVYCTLSLCHERKRHRIFCCLPVLYVWLTAHVVPRRSSDLCPVSELVKANIPTYNDKEWVQMFIELKEETVRWYPLGTRVKQVLLRCGEFPNVPLIGTLGCINYNPVLALRQLRYPITGPPAAGSLSPFYAKLDDKSMLDKIRKAWKNVVLGGQELGRRSHGASDTYKEWVRERVDDIKLPFQKAGPRPRQETDTVLEDSDEVKILKEKLAAVEKEKGVVEDKLREARLILKALEMECSEKAQSLKNANKRARVEKESRSKTREQLSSTNQDLMRRIDECNHVVKENEQLRKAIGEKEQQVNTLQVQMNEQASRYEADQRIEKQASLEVLKEYRELLEEERMKVEGLVSVREEVLEENWTLKGEIMSLEAAHAETKQRLANIDRKMQEQIDQYVVQYEEMIRNLKTEAAVATLRYRAAIDRKDEKLRSLGHWAEERNQFLGMIRAVRVNFIEAWYEVGHWAHKLKEVRRIPGFVRDAEAMINPLTTPREPIELIDVCKRLTEDFEVLIEEAKKNVALDIINV